MTVLECPIPKSEWIHQFNEGVGVSVPVRDNTAEMPTAGVGSWEPAIEKITQFQHLGDDWDGLGATGPTHELLESAIGLAHLFREKGVDPPHCVVPGLDGSVNLEWQDPDGTIAEVEIDRPFHAEVMVIEPGRPPRFWSLPTE